LAAPPVDRQETAVVIEAADLDAFFDEALATYAEVVAAAERPAGQSPAGRAGEIVRNYTVAGRPMRVRYANSTLADGFHPALAHLEVVSNDMERQADDTPFVVHVWAGDVPGGQLPRPPWESVDFFERGGVRGYHGDRHMLVFDRRPGVFSGVDRNRQAGVFWARDTARVPYQEWAAPFRRVLPGWRHADGLFAVHASAVGGGDGGVLLAGRTGSGKSTTSVLCIGSSLSFAGDDFMLVQTEPEPYVHSLYSSAKLNRAVLGWRSDLAAAVVDRDALGTDKAVIHAALAWPQHVTSGFVLRAIALPRPTSERATVARQVTSDVAFKALLADTLFTTHGPVRQVTRGLRDLVASVPCFELALGTDVAAVPLAIEDLLHQCRGTT
jgi:hypothetical protein